MYCPAEKLSACSTELFSQCFRKPQLLSSLTSKLLSQTVSSFFSIQKALVLYKGSPISPQSLMCISTQGFFVVSGLFFFYSGCSIRLQAFLQFSDLRIQVTVSIRTASSSFFMRCLQFFLPVLPGCACRCRSSLLLWAPCLLFPVFLTLVLPMDGFASSCLWQHKSSVPLQPLCCTSAAAGCYR